MNRTGYNCDNGRSHLDVMAVDLNAAIAACRSQGLPGYPDFCHVLDVDGGTSADASQCSAQASWRPKNSCCNFKGKKSCPL
jgi:hypothetical protein